MRAKDYLPYVYVKHQRNINAMYLFGIDYKITNNLTGPVATMIERIKPAFERLTADEKQEYSLLVTEVKQLWLLKKGSTDGSVASSKTSGATSRPQPPPNPNQINPLDERKKILRSRAEVFHQYLNSEKLEHEHLIFGDVIALINEEMPNRDDFLPSEIVLVKYSIRKGIHEPLFHTFIDPGKIWLGYRAQFQEHMEKHQIPEFYEDAIPEPRFSEVFNKINQFVASSVKIPDIHNPCKGVIPVITSLESVKKVKYTLNAYLRECHLHASQENPRNSFVFEVFSLDEALVSLLYRSPIRNDQTIDILIKYSQNESNSTEFDNLPKMMCEYHTDAEATICAQANARKLCYMTTSALIKEGHYQIDLGPQNMPVAVSSAFEKSLKGNQDDTSSVTRSAFFCQQQDGESTASVISSRVPDSEISEPFSKMKVTKGRGWGRENNSVNCKNFNNNRNDQVNFNSQARYADSVTNYSSTYSATPYGDAGPRKETGWSNSSQSVPFDADDDVSSVGASSVYAATASQSSRKVSGRSRQPASVLSYQTSTVKSSMVRPGSQQSHWGTRPMRASEQVSKVGAPSVHSHWDEDDDDQTETGSMISSHTASSVGFGRAKGRGRGHGFGKGKPGFGQPIQE